MSSFEWSRFGQAAGSLPKPTQGAPASTAASSAASSPAFAQLAKRQIAVLEGLAALKKEMEAFAQGLTPTSASAAPQKASGENKSSGKKEAPSKSSASGGGGAAAAAAPTAASSAPSAEKKEEKPVPPAKLPPPLSMARSPTVSYEAVVHASVSRPPAATVLLAYLLNHRSHNAVRIQHHWHSTAGQPPAGFVAEQRAASSLSASRVRIVFIWKQVPTTHLLVSAAQSVPVEGDANAARFLSRAEWPELALSGNAAEAIKVDEWVDTAGSVAGSRDLKQLLKEANGALGKSEHLVSQQLSLADIACWGTIFAHGGAAGEKNVQRWYAALGSLSGAGEAAAFLSKYVVKPH